MSRVVTIQGLQFELPDAPYEAGHVLTEAEANTLNQTWTENIRNNCRKTVLDAIEKAKQEDVDVDTDSLQASITDYATDYEFGQRGEGATRIVDPVEREAMNLAKERVKAALKKQGQNLKEVGAEKINELAADALEKYPQFRELAAKRVEEQNALSAELDI